MRAKFSDQLDRSDRGERFRIRFFIDVIRISKFTYIYNPFILTHVNFLELPGDRITDIDRLGN